MATLPASRRTRMLPLPLAFALLGALAPLGACDDGVVAPGAVTSTATSPGAGEAEVTTAAGALRASLRVRPSTLAPGETMTVRFTLANSGRTASSVTLSCTAPAFLSLRRADTPPGGESINGSGCGAAISEVRLAAGAERVMEMRFPASEIATSGGPGRPLAPGRYVIEARPTVIEIDGVEAGLAPLQIPVTVR